MKGLVIAAIALVLPAAVQAESLPVRLKDGATWAISGTHVRDGVGARAQKWTLKTVKTLVWSAPKTGQGARLTVNPVSATVGPDSPPEVPRARSLGIPAVVEVDDALNPGAAVNVDEVRAAFQEVLGRDIRGSEALADAAAHAMIASELAWAARGQGGELALGKTIETDGVVENPIGGPPIKVRDSYRLESYDATAGRAVIIWRQAADSAAFAKDIVASMAERMKSTTPSLKPEAIQAALRGASGTLESNCRHEIDLATGLALRADCRTTNAITIQGETRGTTDTWTITQTLPEPR